MSFLAVIAAAVIVFVLFKIKVIYGVIGLVAALLYLIYTYFPNYYMTKGNLAYQKLDYAEAKKWYKKAIDTHRVKIKTRVAYTQILLKNGDFDEAEEVLNFILRHTGLKPADKNLCKQQRCMVHLKQGRFDEAYEEAMELFNDGYKNTVMYGMIGYFKLLNNDPLDETLKFCQEAFEYNNEDRDIMDNLSICYYKMGDYEKAKELSDKLMETNPTFVEAYYHAAQIALKCKDFKGAKEYTDKIPSCNRSQMTTVSEAEVEELVKEINAGLV